MRQDDGKTVYSDGLPRWFYDMRPQAYLGRAYAARYGAALQLPERLVDWNDTHALTALLAHGGDGLGNLLLGDAARDHFRAAPAPSPSPIAPDRKIAAYVQRAREAAQGEIPGPSAGGEQPKFRGGFTNRLSGMFGQRLKSPTRQHTGNRENRMAIELEEQARKRLVREISGKMMIAARTAPKAKGIDKLVIATIDGPDIQVIASKMKDMVAENQAPEGFARDADNLLNADCLFLIGTRIEACRVQNCGQCGFDNCAEKEKHPKIPCHYNSCDLGIAMGSAVSIAADNRVDNRIMRSIGKAAIALKLFGDGEFIAYGIPLSSSGKSPFFDR